mmetsp:Transcript_8722/g.14795  ORF Transcript_8722/g.14795 Transcript_8722/m.14795 type:complete len:163 (+) Transcript_8722:106-594(+)
MIDKNDSRFMDTSSYLQRYVIYSPIFTLMLHLYTSKGVRMHLMPLVSGFLGYTFGLSFLIFEETLYYYYALTTLLSLMLMIFFGHQNYYESFSSDRGCINQVGCKVARLEALPFQKEGGGIRVFAYYPTFVADESKYEDLNWATHQSHLLEGFSKFSFGYLP